MYQPLEGLEINRAYARAGITQPTAPLPRYACTVVAPLVARALTNLPTVVPTGIGAPLSSIHVDRGAHPCPNAPAERSENWPARTEKNTRGTRGPSSCPRYSDITGITSLYESASRGG